MSRLIVSSLLAIFLGFTSFSAQASGANDKIIGVYICDSNHISLNTQNEGWVLIYVPDVTTTAANWMLSTAMMLLTTGNHTGGFFEPTPNSPMNDGCGHNGPEITTLYALAT